MGDLLGGLIVLLVSLVLIPVIFLIVLLALALAGAGILVGLIAAVFGIAVHLVIWAAPLIVVFGLIWLIFGGRRREVARG
ncbi:MAG: hypothetical protein GC190_15070 [Alphaproteobacteria bacterium]|nr:hypothetical protein [Alphaproteobacteria bacterium]